MKKIAAVIAEYNPFHNGHQYLLRQIRQISGADYILVVMSGDYVQRGEPAVYDKYTRTRMALAGGADAVIELPVACATGSARRFAEGAIAILNITGVVQELWFGSETGDTGFFLRTSQYLSAETDFFKEALQQYLKSGMSYPAAREKALRDVGVFPDENAVRAFRSPNDILGLEYCIALNRTGSFIIPHTIQRIGEAHDADITRSIPSSPASGNTSALIDRTIYQAYRAVSASTIRRQISKTLRIDDSLKPYIPAEVLSVMEEASFVDPGSADALFSFALHYQLMKDTVHSVSRYLDVPADLARRIINHMYDFSSLHTFAETLKTKNTTRTQINRALLHIILGIRQDDFLSAVRPKYLRLLGFRKESEPLLKMIKDNASAPLTTRVLSIPGGYSVCDFNASTLYENAKSEICGTRFVHEYEQQVIIV